MQVRRKRQSRDMGNRYGMNCGDGGVEDRKGDRCLDQTREESYSRMRRWEGGFPLAAPAPCRVYCYSPQRAGPAMEMAPVGRWILMRVEEAVAVTRLVADAKLASPRSVRTWLPEW